MELNVETGNDEVLQGILVVIYDTWPTNTIKYRFQIIV
jgi:hypothetical protein